MMKQFEIPVEEFKQRVVTVQQEMKRQNLDLLLAYGNEAEPQYVRYFSDYWPSFETAGVLIPASGEPFLLIGPESMTYAADRSKIKEIRRLRAFRESSEPEYPDARIGSVADVIAEILGGAPLRRLGIAGWGVLSHTVYEFFAEAVKGWEDAEIVKADKLVNDIKSVKSENELTCMREAYRITKIGFHAALEKMRPGMTEIQVRGLALAAMYEAGAETEAYPMWCLSGHGTEQAISRPRHKPLGVGEIIQLQVGCRIAGYASSIGRPLVFGKASPKIRALIEAGYAGQQAVLNTLRAGIPARNVDEAYRAEMRRIGYDDWLLYGPCHGTGLMEGEPPWMESNSEWLLQENMTFCVDTFLGKAEERMGLRIEDGVRITAEGCEQFSNERREIIEL